MVTSKRKIISTPYIRGKTSQSVTKRVVLCDHCGEEIPESTDTFALDVRCYVCGRHTCQKCRLTIDKYPIVCKDCSDHNTRLDPLLMEKKRVGDAQDALTNLSIQLGIELDRMSYLSGKGKYLGTDPN